MHAPFRALCALAIALAAGCASAPEGDGIPPQARHGEFPDESLTVDGAKRVYRLFVPASVALARPAPLVVAFHGMLVDSKDVMPRYTKLNETAERHAFIMVYPNAAGGVWGILPDKVRADIGFFDALLA